MDFPAVSQLPTHIGSWSKYSAGGTLRPIGSMQSAVQTWVANLSMFVPIYLPWPYPVKRMWWVNGSTATGNVAVGIFGPNGKRLYASASTAQSGATNVQYVSLGTPLWLSPGKFYLAFACDTTTSRVHGQNPSTQILSMIGVLQQASNLALADPATFATPTNALYPYVGITRTASGF